MPTAARTLRLLLLGFAVALAILPGFGAAAPRPIPTASAPKQAAPTDPYTRRLAAALALIGELKFIPAYRELAELENDFPAHAAEVQALRHDVGRVIYTVLPPPDPRMRKRVVLSQLTGFAQVQYTAFEKAWTNLCAAPTADLLKAMDLFVSVKEFNVANPNFTGGWLLQLRMSLALDRPVEGAYAGQQLYFLGLARSINDEVIALFAAAQKRGWMIRPPPLADSTAAHLAPPK